MEPRRLFAVHLTIVAVFALANVLIGIADVYGYHQVFGLSRLMRLDKEANLPSTFSALALAACVIAAAAVRGRLQTDDPDRSAWRLLALFFAVLALDETAVIHEMFNRVGYEFATTGVLTYVGAFFYIPILIWLVARLLPFWLRQDAAMRVGLAVAGGIYVSAALGMELVGNGLHGAGHHSRDPLQRMTYIVEECGEMLGVALFLRIFLQRFSRLGGGPLIKLAIPDTRGDRPD